MEGIQTQTTNKVTITDFCNLIDMALQNKITWKSLCSFLMDITQNLENLRQVTVVLLKKLEELHIRLLQKEMDLANESEKQSPCENVENTSEDTTFENENHHVDISYEPDKEDSLPETKTIEDDIEVLEVIEERIDAERYSKFTESEKSLEYDRPMSENNENSSRIEEVNYSGKEIDNEWYKFVTNDK